MAEAGSARDCHGRRITDSFEAAARHLSFTAAGAELFLTQSAISRQVQTLEEQLGVKLFQRRTRALVLTESGALYYREVAKALQQLRDATASVRAATNPVVTVTTTVVECVIDPAVPVTVTVYWPGATSKPAPMVRMPTPPAVMYG